MTKRVALVAVVLWTVISAALAADAPPAPSFDRVQYDRPDDYLVLNPSLGSAARIRAAAARGNDLVITCVGPRLVLPPGRHDLLPIPYDQIQAKVRATKSGVERKTAGDGTRVVLLYTPDVPAMQKLVDELAIDPPR